MSNKYYRHIKQQYQNLQGDSTELFREILMAASEIGMDQALVYLEQCVIEKRSAWIKRHASEIMDESDPAMAGYKWFYEKYLQVSVPKDGMIVEQTGKRIIMRWWNPCPTLEACNKFGLDTRGICRKAYHRPVQEFLKHIHPKLRFDRNYENIRPHAAYCEEIIVLED
jgi:hypothetical protein